MTVHRAAMKKKEVPSSRRAEIQRLFDRYASEQSTLQVDALLAFLQKEQMEHAANEETANTLITRYEIDETENCSMTFAGFHRYMESKDCCLFNHTHTAVYQDMDQPLTSYFISSSHNTYLTRDQLVGKSHLDAYVIALRRGCRCLEIDCWDGPDMEPLVYHGHTLTTKILFKDVIQTVEQHAFEVSAYPVILSLENHCCPEQQEVMAQYLITILGDKLLKAPLDHPTTGDLPSPNKTELVAKALSDLVIYTRSVKFINFSHSRDNQNFYENTSMAEAKAQKLIKKSGADFVQHNQRFLSRIYPSGSRVLSSNYNPQDFWNVGSQLVALNFQTLGLPMDLNDGRFLDNGGCGYVLKPVVLMSDQGFDPGGQSSHTPTQLLLKVISGANLPVNRSGKGLDPFVRVEIHGCRTIQKQSTNHAHTLTPHWDTNMDFTISAPELCLVRFCVKHQTGPLTSEFVGQYTLPFTSMKKGQSKRKHREESGAGGVAHIKSEYCTQPE
uniref:Phosphoinositide phospholipase C n=1 Tax=Cynoglossus semilaevis TaxID=244447 RepID=A0A3P8W2C1_CYNSE